MTYFGLRWELEDADYKKFIKKFSQPNQSTISFRADLLKEGLMLRYTCDEGMDSPYVAKVYYNVMKLDNCDLHPDSFDKYFGRIVRDGKYSDPKLYRAIETMNKLTGHSGDLGELFAIYDER